MSDTDNELAQRDEKVKLEKQLLQEREKGRAMIEKQPKKLTRQVQLCKQERSRDPTSPERSFGQSDTDSERETTSSSGKEGDRSSSDEQMLYESDAQQNQVPTKSGYQGTTANKKRRLKNQVSEHRSEKRKKDNNPVARARRRKNNRNWGARGQPLKNKKPRSKKKQKTTGATSAQSTTSLEILPRQANKDDETTTPSSSSDKEDISSQDISVVRGYRRDEEETPKTSGQSDTDELDEMTAFTQAPGETPKTSGQSDTDELDEMTAAIFFIPSSPPSILERNTSPNIYEQTETNTEHGLNFTFQSHQHGRRQVD